MRKTISLVLLGLLALCAWATNDTLPPEHWFEPAGYYTRAALGEVSNLFGMGRTMVGASIITGWLAVAVVLSGIAVMVAPFPFRG